MNITKKSFLKIAIPFVLSTITQPLLGAIDTAVIGHLDKEVYLAGVSTGTVIFNTMYWLFGFLRISTSANSAQAIGNQQKDKMYESLILPSLIAAAIGLLFILGQKIIFNLSLQIMNVTTEVSLQTHIYFKTLIWMAPIVLMNYVFLGWLMGRKNTKATVFLQIIINIINIILSVLFVVILDWKVFGVAFSTVVAQIIAFIVGLYLVLKELPKPAKRLTLSTNQIKKYLVANIDLVIRTICLLVVTNLFMRMSNSFGTSYLAANAVLWQIQYLIVYCFDGIGNAVSVFGGEALGAQDKKAFEQLMILIKEINRSVTIFLTILLLFTLSFLVKLFTSIEIIQAIAQNYQWWLLLFPVAISLSSILYGLYTGFGVMAPIRNSMIQSTFVFIVGIYLLVPRFGNHGLWVSFIIYSAARSILLVIYQNQLKQKFET